MKTSEIKRKYPENLLLKVQMKEAGRTVKWIADKLEVSTKVISDTINGKYKGENIVPKIKKLISQS